jgi:probable addiction module antidote protein
MAKKKATNYRKHLMDSLQDPKEALEYLQAALEEKDMPDLFLVALRNVAEARGIGSIAREAQLNRENLYRILSKKGNPRFSSLYAILDALGLKLSVMLKKAS